MPEPNQTTDPLDTPLPCDVKVPGAVFRKGVSLRTFVTAAARWKAKADEAFAASLPPGALDEFRKLQERGP